MREYLGDDLSRVAAVRRLWEVGHGSIQLLVDALHVVRRAPRAARTPELRVRLETRAVAATERRLPLAVYGDDEQQYAHHGSIVIMVLGCPLPRNDE